MATERVMGIEVRLRGGAGIVGVRRVARLPRVAEESLHVAGDLNDLCGKVLLMTLLVSVLMAASTRLERSPVISARTAPLNPRL